MTSDAPDPREQKLPQWARMALSSLRSRNSYLESQITDLETDLALMSHEPIEGNNTWRENLGVDGAVAVPLGVDVRIRFDLPGAARVGGRYIVAYVENGRFVVDGSHPLTIRPAVANSARLDVEEG